MKRTSILVCTIVFWLPLILSGCDRGAEERAKLQEAEKELAELKSDLRKTSSERDRLKSELAAATKERDDLQTQVNKLTTEEKNLRDQVDDLTSSRQSLNGKVTELNDSIDELKGKLKGIAYSRDQLRNEIAALKNSRDMLQAQVKELTKQRDEAIAKEQQAQKELAILTAKIQAEEIKIDEPNDGLVEIAESPPKKETPKVGDIKPPTVHSFASARTKVDKGQSATLTWHVSDASEIQIEPGIGSVSALGSTNVKPKETTTYTLTATNGGGQTVETCRVEVR